MTTEITENGQGRTAVLPAGLAEQLVATAKAQGLALTGPGGLLTGLTKQVLETALEVEMSEHLGHDRGERSTSGNMRNGSSAKTASAAKPPTKDSVRRPTPRCDPSPSTAHRVAVTGCCQCRLDGVLAHCERRLCRGQAWCARQESNLRPSA